MPSIEERKMASLWQHCKIVEIDESGKLKFNSAKLSMLLKLINSDKPTDNPVIMIAVVGPPRSGKSFFTNLILHYLKKSGKIGWMNDLLRGSPLTGFEFGRGESSVMTSSYLCPDSDSSGIYAYPELLNVDENVKLTGLMLHVHFNSAASWERDRDRFHAFLSIACSHLLEIQEGNDQCLPTTFLSDLNNDLRCNQFLCRSIASLQRGRVTGQEENNEKQIHMIAESYDCPVEKCAARFSILESKKIKAIFPVMLNRQWNTKNFNDKPLSLASLDSFMLICVELTNSFSLVKTRSDDYSEKRQLQNLDVLPSPAVTQMRLPVPTPRRKLH